MRRLHWRIYLHFLGVLVAVGVTSSVVFGFGTREVFLREVVERTTRHVAALVGETIDDPRALDARLAQVRRDLEVDVTVRNLDGTVLATTGRPLPAPSRTEIDDVRGGHMVARPGPRRFAVVSVPDRTSGHPRATLALSPARRFPLRGFLVPAIAVALALVVVGVATRPLARRLSRPIEQITATARRFGHGDLAARVAAPRRRRRHADELTELADAFNDMAEHVARTVRDQKELLANVSHELRSPLTRIRMALELLPRDASTQPRLAALERDLDDLERLIDDVLTSARLEATGLPIELGPLDVVALLEDLADRARQTPSAAAARIVVDAAPLTLVADGTLLRRALWNLLENAMKYGAPPITLMARSEATLVVLGVQDEGPGIPAADRERVFAPFVRGERARTAEVSETRRHGVGLGLTLARRVAEVHGGTITVEPIEITGGRERGCRVMMRIPLERA